MNDDYTANSHYLTYSLVGRMCLLNFGAKELTNTFFLQIDVVYREGRGETYFYSCKSHLDEVLTCLEEDRLEKNLLSALKDMYSTMTKQMQVTEDLLEASRGLYRICSQINTTEVLGIVRRDRIRVRTSKNAKSLQLLHTWLHKQPHYCSAALFLLVLSLQTIPSAFMVFRPSFILVMAYRSRLIHCTGLNCPR